MAQAQIKTAQPGRAEGYELEDDPECGSSAGSLTDIVIRRRRMPAVALAAMGPMDITAYWNHVRSGRRFPSAASMDRKKLARDWPNTVLMRCDSERQLLALHFSQVHGLLSSSDFSTMAIEWIRSLCMEAVAQRHPIEKSEAFPTKNGPVSFRAVALPLSGDDQSVDHVLFHVRGE